MIKSQDAIENKIRVCMVASRLYPLYAGGGLQALRLSMELHQKDIEITIFTRNTGAFLKKESIDGIPIYRMPNPGSSKLSAAIFAVCIFGFMLRNRCHIVHIHGAELYTYVAIIIAKMLRKKSIVKMTLISSDDPLSIRDRQPFGKLEFRILGLADRINCISQELSESYRRSGLSMDRLKEIPNGVDTQHFCPVSGKEKQKIRQALGLPPNGAIVTFTGKICHRKGIDILIKSWHEVAQEFPSARLLLIGPNNDNLEDPYVRSLHYQINELNLADKVFYTGRVKNVNQYLQASDVFAFPSRRDSTPSAILEAMACGLPCVAMETAGVSRPLVNEENGLIFESEDSHQLAQHVLRLLKKPAYARQLGEEARKTVLTSFSLGSIAERYLELYRELLGAKA